MAKTSLARLAGVPGREALSQIKTAKQAFAASAATHSYEVRYRELQAQFEVRLNDLRTEYLVQLAEIAADAED